MMVREERIPGHVNQQSSSHVVDAREGKLFFLCRFLHKRYEIMIEERNDQIALE